MNVVKELLNNIGNFSNEQVILFSERAIIRNLQKNEILLNEGEVCKSAFYIISGEAFQFCYDDIDENIFDLHIENEWCLNHSSFVTQKPSSAIIKAYSGLTVLDITIDGEIEQWIFGNMPLALKDKTPRFQVPRFHRTLSFWINSIIQAGFSIEQLNEPCPSDKIIQEKPSLHSAGVVGQFLHIRCRIIN